MTVDSKAAGDLGQTVGGALQAFYGDRRTHEQVIEREATAVGLTGMLYSLSWGNSFLKTANRDAFYCPPESLSIDNDQVMQILRTAVRARPYVAQ
jgi:hypothetical protein